MGAEIGQTSQYEPAVIYDGGSSYGGYSYHMLFCSRDSSNRLLYCDSQDGQNWNFIGQVSGNTTGSSPAIALSQNLSSSPPLNLLVAVYVANDPSKRILYSTLDLTENRSARGWRDRGQVDGESAHWVFALAQRGSWPINLYYLSNVTPPCRGRDPGQSWSADPLAAETKPTRWTRFCSNNADTGSALVYLP